MGKDTKQQYFTTQLLYWHTHDNGRSLPWKGERDPYRIWLSEVILQQTRAEQGLKYYLTFTEHYPSVCDMAAAQDEEVFRLWQGLGYYNRCKNMLATARYICKELGGIFPGRHEDILSLKGVGAYTAAAIASFAFGLPHAVVDGNVYRVLSRYFGIEAAIDGTEGKRMFAGLAQQLLDEGNSAAYNQAIMDLGATVCTPKSPDCTQCPLNKKCSAYKEGLTALLPVKSKKLQVQHRFFNFIMLRYRDEIWIRKRTEKGIWQNLHEFFLIESENGISVPELKDFPVWKKILPQGIQPMLLATSRQRLTHQLIDSKLYSVVLQEKPEHLPAEGFWVKAEQIGNYAFPKTLVDFLGYI
ncbi:MAG TPA: A/G-specific adenine glycosylase [Chitinophagaceae bacterium]|nr:A/G-specific adenine glycosylase [Chitinophagaceae bacterium]